MDSEKLEILKSIEETPCLSCEIIESLGDLGAKLAQNASDELSGPISMIFMAISGVWVIIAAIKLALKQWELQMIVPEVFFLVFSLSLIIGNLDGLLMPAYEAMLSLMTGAAQTVFAAGGTEVSSDYEGMSALMVVVEKGIKTVFDIAGTLMATYAPPLAYQILAVLLVLPYVVLFCMYFSQILVAMFRLMMLALLAPFLVAAFGFPWGRPMAFAGLRTALGAVMVLFAATAAVSLALSGIHTLEIDEIENMGLVKDFATLGNAKFLLMILMGWLGVALMMVGTELANSIVGTLLTNAAAGMMTAGMTGTALSLAKFANPATAGSRIAGLGQKMGAEGAAWGTIKGMAQGKDAALKKFFEVRNSGSRGGG